jgi:hypothetical protein
MKLYSKKDGEIVEQVHSWLQSARDSSKDWRKEARENYDFYAGRHWTQEEVAAMEEDLRNAVTFNRITPLVDAIAGHQINNRAEVRFLPRQIGDAQVSEVLTGAGKWVEDEADTDDEEEEIFQDLIITGMAWSECRMSYDEDIDGQVIPGERFSPLEAYWDPNSSRRNLSDAKWRGRGRWMNRDDALAKWPDLDEVDWTSDKFISQDEADDEPHNAARSHFYENDSRQWYNKHKDEVFILHVQWWEHESIYRIGDPVSGKLLELSSSKFKKLQEYVESNGIQYVKQMRRTYYYAFIAGPTVLEKGKNPWEKGFTLQCATGKRDATKGDWFGVVRALKDPQKWSNKFLSDLQDMIVSNRQGGAFVEETALVDTRKAEEDWNRSNPLILVRDGALQRGAIVERNPPALPPALDRMLEYCITAIPAVSGINQEFMGYADREQPNVLEMSRKWAAINVLASMFSSLRKYRKDRARAMLHMIRTYMNDGRLIRIVGGDGLERFIPLALDPGTEDYDIVIDEASTSPNQKEETFGVMMALMPYLVQAGIAPPVEVLDYMPLPASFIGKWKETLQPKGPTKQDQMLEAAAGATVAKDQADAMLKQVQARKMAAEAQAQELENEAVRLGLVSIEDL